MELLVIAILIGLTGSQVSQLKGPENALGVVGSDVRLKCLSQHRNCAGIDWLQHISDNNSATTVFSDSVGISDAFKDRYSVDNSSGCNLIIKNVELSDAGRFICRSFASPSYNEKAAYLTVLETQPRCAMNASVDDIVAGDGVLLTCEVKYSGTLSGSMVWRGVKDASAAVETGGTIIGSHYVVASAPRVPPFACTTSFAVDDDNGAGIGVIASNVVHATCETPAAKLLYSVGKVQVWSSTSKDCPGSVFNCNAMGHPYPTLRWQQLEADGTTWINVENQNGCSVTTRNVPSKRYRCFARNVVRGKNYSSTSREFFTNDTEFYDNYFSTTMTPAKGRLGVGGGVGIVIVIVLAFIACAVFTRLRHSDFSPRPDRPIGGEAHRVDSGVNNYSSPSSAKQTLNTRPDVTLV